MGTRRRQLLLGAVVVALAVVVYVVWPTTSAGTSPTSNRQPQVKTGDGAAADGAGDVHLSALDAERAKPDDGGRDLFRFKTKPLPPPAPRVTQPMTTTPAMTAPAGPPPLAPITLKFIGLVESAEHKQKIAILSDGRNTPFWGREGDIIEGRYRILKIGVESIELAYVDGRGRQTIRLAGG